MEEEKPITVEDVKLLKKIASIIFRLTHDRGFKEATLFDR